MLAVYGSVRRPALCTSPDHDTQSKDDHKSVPQDHGIIRSESKLTLNVELTLIRSAIIWRVDGDSSLTS